MVNAGIDAARLTAVGYGEDKAIATNRTAAGRAKNRRTEFMLIQ
jgi:outer membrane protein OmpA-like peptidoglycan-associated protein